MKSICKNRFLVWLMYLIPIAFTGWFSVIIWTVIQLVLCDRQVERRKECKVVRTEKRSVEKEQKEKRMQEQIEHAKKLGKSYMIVNGEVYTFESK